MKDGKRNFCAMKIDQNNKTKTGKVTKHIAKMNNGLGGAKIDEILDRTKHANHDYERQKDNIYLEVDEEICGEFDFENKCVKDKNFKSDTALKEYIKSTPYYHDKDKYGRTHKLSDENIVCREFTFWFSPDQKERMKDNIEEWGNANLKFIKDEFPTFKVVCAVVHMHESNPHMQAIVIPFDEKGKLNNYKYFYDDQDNELKKSKKKATGSRTAQELQTKYAEVVGKKFDLERGEMGNYEAVRYEEHKTELAIKKAKQAQEKANREEQISNEIIEKAQLKQNEWNEKIAQIDIDGEQILKRQKEIVDNETTMMLESYIKKKDKELQDKKEGYGSFIDNELENYKEIKKIELIQQQRIVDKDNEKRIEAKRKESNLVYKEYEKIVDEDLALKMQKKDEEIKKMKSQMESESFESLGSLRKEIREIEESNNNYQQYLMKKGIETNSAHATTDDYDKLLKEAGKFWRLAYELEKLVSNLFKQLERIGIYRPMNNDIREQILALTTHVNNVTKIFEAGRKALGIRNEAPEIPTRTKSKGIDIDRTR